MPPKAAGREIPHEGLPPGWKAIEKTYLSGTCAGQTYIRFQNEKHSSVGSLKKAVSLHAEDNGEDPEEALREFDRRKEEASEARKAEREAKGFLEGQKRDDAVAAFRAKYGKLDGATVCELPGWRGESKLLERCGQLCARYYAPNGQSYPLVVNIEALFGVRMLNNEEIPDIEAARARVKTDEYGKVINIARNEHVVQELTGIIEPVVKKAKRRHADDERRLAKSEDYRESDHLEVVRLLAAGSSEELRAKGVPEVEALERSVAEIYGLLVSRGFPSETELVYVTGSRNSRTPGRKLLDAVAGVYYLRPERFNERPYYQKVGLAESPSSTLVCGGQFISWSSLEGLWKIGALDDTLAGLAVCRQDKPNPADLDQKWMLYEPWPDGSQNEGATKEDASAEEPNASSEAPGS